MKKKLIIFTQILLWVEDDQFQNLISSASANHSDSQGEETRETLFFLNQLFMINISVNKHFPILQKLQT